MQACHPAEVSTSPLSCNDLRIPTSEVEFDLAHRQVQAVSKMYARLNGNAFGIAPTGALGERQAVFPTAHDTHGLPWKPTMHAQDRRDA